MRWLILKVIDSYWCMVSPTRRRDCLFQETCSQHVYRVTRQDGSLAGTAALIRRCRRCRNGYAVECDAKGRAVLRLADGSLALVEDLSDSMARFVYSVLSAQSAQFGPGKRF